MGNWAVVHGREPSKEMGTKKQYSRLQLNLVVFSSEMWRERQNKRAFGWMEKIHGGVEG